MDLDFTDHARREMRRDQIPEAAVYDVVGDADAVIERRDGRTEYRRFWEGRAIVVVIEGDRDPLLVVTVWEDKRRKR
jgi:Domain of unknown function (DUF4258)